MTFPGSASSPHLSGCSPTVGGSGPRGWLAPEQFVGGEPQIAATWSKDFQHMLPLAACHRRSLPANITLRLKEGKLPDQCFSYSPVSGLHGESHSSPCQQPALGRGWGRGSGLVGVGGGSRRPLALSEGCWESPLLVCSWAGRRPVVLLPLRVSPCSTHPRWPPPSPIRVALGCELRHPGQERVWGCPRESQWIPGFIGRGWEWPGPGEKEALILTGAGTPDFLGTKAPSFPRTSPASPEGPVLARIGMPICGRPRSSKWGLLFP